MGYYSGMFGVMMKLGYQAHQGHTCHSDLHCHLFCRPLGPSWLLQMRGHLKKKLKHFYKWCVLRNPKNQTS